MTDKQFAVCCGFLHITNSGKKEVILSLQKFKEEFDFDKSIRVDLLSKGIIIGEKAKERRYTTKRSVRTTVDGDTRSDRAMVINVRKLFAKKQRSNRWNVMHTT